MFMLSCHCCAVLTGVELLFMVDSESDGQDGDASKSPKPPPSSASPSPGLGESRPSFIYEQKRRVRERENLKKLYLLDKVRCIR